MPSSAAPTRSELLRAERAIAPVPRGGGPLRVALVYPNTYHLGMSSLGYQLVWRIIHDHPGASPERFFTDTLAWGSLETGAPLADFDLIAISACYEMDEPNILDVIEAAGQPLEAARRAPGPHRPLILLGGVLAEVNRLPLFPFIDVFSHGDAEIIMPRLLDALAPVRGASGGDRLAAIEGVAGIEITPGARAAAGLPVESALEPFITVPGERDEAANLTPPAPPPRATATCQDGGECATQILTPHTEFADMALVDLARGCPHHCTFCWIGHNTPSFRARPADAVIAAMEARRHLTDRFGLVSSAVGAHPDIDEICRWAMARELRISYSSLRVEEVTPVMLEALARGGQKTITIAPEAGSMRVRRLLGKMISDEEILEVADRALALGAENIKLYTMIGIPSETDEEALEIARFAERVREVMLRRARARGRIGYLGINLGIFVPKPNLPLNHIEPVPLPAIKKRLKRLVRELNRIPNTRVNVSSPDLAVAQSILSVGGLEAARYLLLVREAGGDWRAASRRWRREADRHFETHARRGRIAADSLRARARATGNP